MPITTLAALKKGQTKTGSNSTSEDCNSGNETILHFLLHTIFTYLLQREKCRYRIVRGIKLKNET